MKIDFTGHKFHMLTVVEFIKTTKERNSYWLFRCDCGVERVLRIDTVKSGNTKSCGCLKSKELIGERATKHGMHKTRLYKLFQHVKQRCTNPKVESYYLYGGKGVSVCREWLDSYDSFHTWAMSNGYKDNLTIDRIDSNGNYEPTNCRWATTKQQAENKSTNIIIEFDGFTGTLKSWGEKLNISHQVLYYRYNKKGLRAPQLFFKKPSK